MRRVTEPTFFEAWRIVDERTVVKGGKNVIEYLVLWAQEREDGTAWLTWEPARCVRGPLLAAWK